MRPEKNLIIDEIKTRVDRAPYVLLTDYTGMQVPQFNELRNRLSGAKAEYRVVKNSLTRIALKNAGMSELADMLEGPTAIVVERGDAIAATKAVFEFAKTHVNLKIKGGIFEGKVISAMNLKALAALPSREVLLAQLLGTLQAPMVNLVSVLQAPMRDLVGVLDQIAKKAPESK